MSNWWDDVEPPQGWHINPDGSPGGTMTADPSPLEPDVWLWPAYTTQVEPPEGPSLWDWETMSWVPQEPVEPEPDPGPLPPAAVVIALAELGTEGGEVTGFETSCGLGFGFMMDTGVFLLFFTTPQPDNKYLPFVQCPDFGIEIRVTARETDYLEVTARDRATNEPTIPDGFVITVQRTQ